MASGADVRDVFDIPASEVQPRPAKKQKVVEKRPEGVPRELFALLGERAAPISITEHVKYKERPKWNQKVSQWEMKPFVNPARVDGLVLKHWQRKSAAADSNQESGEAGSDATPDSLNYHFAKFNVKVDIPEYTDEEYDKVLKDDDWTRDETDYLFNVCRDFDLRWILISDRYEYAPPTPVEDTNGDPSASLSQPRGPRTMEYLKSRYYTCCANLMTLRRPLSDMTPQEYSQHDILTKYDPVSETKRKTIATNLANRSAAEVEEEAVLLTELRRILNDRPRMTAERNDIYNTLQTPPVNQASSAVTSLYSSSAGLSQLMQQLLQQDKHKKRRSLLGPNGEITTNPGATASPTTATGGPSSAHPHNTHRESFSGAVSAGGPNKKNSTATPATPSSRPLSAAEELRWGVSHHERLTSGAALRHERVNKLSTGKSIAQTNRLMSALTELEIPARLVMPTTATCDAFETLVAGINALLEVRKQKERVDGEVKVLEASRAPPPEAEPQPASEAVPAAGGAEGVAAASIQEEEKMDVDAPVAEGAEAKPDVPSAAEGQDGSASKAEGEVEMTDAPPPPPPVKDDADTAAAGEGEADKEKEKTHKRSASVLSQASSQHSASAGMSKRTRKAG